MGENEFLKALFNFITSSGLLNKNTGKEITVRVINAVKSKVINSKQTPSFPFERTPGIQNGMTFYSPAGLDRNPFDEMNEYIRREVMKKAGQLTYFVALKVAKEAPKIAKSYIEYKTDKVVKGDDPKAASLALTSEFLFGYGPEVRYFNENDAITQSLMESNMTTIALEKFYTGYMRYLVGLRSDVPGSYRVDFSLLSDTDPFREFIKDGKFTTAQFTGTSTYYFELEGDVLNIMVYDTKNEYSLLYHIWGDRHKRSENSIMGETTQYYEFSFTLDEIQERLKDKDIILSQPIDKKEQKQIRKELLKTKIENK